MPSCASQTRGQIATLQRTLDVTTVYVTHYQTEAMTMATARLQHPCDRRPAPQETGVSPASVALNQASHPSAVSCTSYGPHRSTSSGSSLPSSKPP